MLAGIGDGDAAVSIEGFWPGSVVSPWQRPWSVSFLERGVVAGPALHHGI